MPNSLPRITLFAHSPIMSGGGEGALIELIREFRNKAEMCVVVPALGVFSNELLKIGIKVEVIDIPWWTEGNTGDQYRTKVIDTLEKLEKHLETFNPTVSITNTSVIPWGAVASKRHNIPHIWFVHEMIDERSEVKYELPLDEVTSIIGDLSDIVVANSQYCLSKLSKKIPKNKLITIMPINHLDETREKAKSQKPKEYSTIPSTDPIVLVVGRILDTKGQEDAVAAIASLRKDDFTAHLFLLGDIQDLYKEKLLTFATKHKIRKQIHILPFNKNPYKYIAHADVVVNTSRLESFGRSTVEAMALRKPIVGANNSSTAQIIKTKENGLLYETNNGDDLAEKIKHILSDNKLQKKIIQGGLETAQEMEATTKLSINELERFVQTQIDSPRTSTTSVVDYLINVLKNNETSHAVHSNPSPKSLRQYIGKVKHSIKRKVRRVL